MVAAVILGLALESQAGAAGTPQEPERPVGELRVVLAAPVYQPDGAVSVETSSLPNGATSLAFVYGRGSICDTATAINKEPAEAGFGWRLMSNTVSHSPTQLVVSIDWRRVWDRGQKVTNGPSGTVQLTLRPGDRIALDHIPNTVASEACRAVGMGLEVRVVRAALPTPPAPAAGRGPVAAPPVLPLGATPGGNGALDADVWLIHTRPTGSEEVLHQKVRLAAPGGTFSFSTVKFQTTKGEIGFEMTGSIQRFRVPTGGPDGSEFLIVDLARVVTGGTAPPSGFRNTTGGTPVALPRPDDVVAFLMPGAEIRSRGGGGGGVGVPRGGATAGGSGTITAAAGGGGARGGGGAGGRGGGMGAVQLRTSMEAAQALVLLEGNVFSLRVRFTPGQ